MAKEDEQKPTAAEKGKGKAPVNGEAEKDAKHGKDAKDDKKGAATATGMFCTRESFVAELALTADRRGAQRGRPAAEERARHARRADTGKLPARKPGYTRRQR
jgi:hypothetical protein